MKIKHVLRDLCPNIVSCPKLYELEDGRLAIQGDVADKELLAALGVPAHETLVIVPRALFPEV
jgi:hypothetical protein